MALRSTFRIDFSLRTAGLLRKTDDEQRSSPFRRPTTDDAPRLSTSRDEHSHLASRLHSHLSCLRIRLERAGPPSRVHQSTAVAPFAVFEGCAPRLSTLPVPTPLSSDLALRSTFRIDFALRTAGLLRKTDDEQRSSRFRRP